MFNESRQSLRRRRDLSLTSVTDAIWISHLSDHDIPSPVGRYPILCWWLHEFENGAAVTGWRCSQEVECGSVAQGRGSVPVRSSLIAPCLDRRQTESSDGQPTFEIYQARASADKDNRSAARGWFTSIKTRLSAERRVHISQSSLFTMVSFLLGAAALLPALVSAVPLAARDNDFVAPEGLNVTYTSPVNS